MKEIRISNEQSLEYTSTLEKINIKLDTKENICETLLWFLSLISFTILFITGWLSLIWLYKYNFVLTFHKYINSVIFPYFPIQLNSPFLFGIIIFTLIIISITYIYYLKKMIYDNDKTFFEKMLSGTTKFHIIPLLLNLGLFIIGELTHKKMNFFHITYYIGFGFVSISLYFLFKLYYEIDFSEDILSDVIIRYLFFSILISLDLYYLFYVVCQIICLFIFELNIIYYLGIVANFFMGIICLYVASELENFITSFFYAIIFNGFIAFHYSIPENIRKEINLNNFEVYSCIIFVGLFIIEMIYLYKRKKQSINVFELE